MRIGIDARLSEETGVGRYIRNLIRNLANIDTRNEYVVFLRAKSFDSFELPGKNWKKVLAEVPWHGITEQVKMPVLLSLQHLDLLHVPYFNIPVFYPGKMIVTIHDLTILHFDTGRATTLPMPLYKIRRIGYRFVLRMGLLRAHHIIAVSETTKREILDHFHVPADKISVTYEGIDAQTRTGTGRNLIGVPYFLYVGNAYPHKNLDVLLAGFRQYAAGNPGRKLVLVGGNDLFYQRLMERVKTLGLTGHVIFFGKATEEELGDLYTHADALVFPSLMEGFGLPALEALAHGCPVICSDIPVFHEILGEAVTYFPADDPQTLALLMKKDLKRPAIQPTRKFDWSVMAARTHTLYERSNHI